MTDVDHGEGRRRPVRIGIFQEPAQEQFLVTFQARLAKKKNAEQQNDQHQQKVKNELETGSRHRAEVKRRK